MLTIYLRFLKDRKNSILMFSLFGTGMLWLYILLFPSMAQLGDDLLGYMESMPPAFTEMFPISQATFANIENFIAMEHYSLMVPLFIIFMMIAMAAISISSEIEQGTAEIILARPVSRTNIFISRYLVGLSGIVIFIAASTLMIIPLAGLHGVDYNLTNFVSISLLCFIFGWAEYSVAMLVSSIFSEKNKVYMIVGGMMIGMYVLQIIASVSNQFENVQYLSFFYYYDYNKAILNNSLDIANILVFVIIAILCSVAGAFWFNKRDVAIQ